MAKIPNRSSSLLLASLACLLLPFGAQAQSGVTASAAALDFGGVGVNTFSEPQTLTLTNSGGGDGEIGTISLIGQDPNQFLISTDFCSSAVLASGESCDIEVTYGPVFDLPGGVGPSSATLQIPFLSSPALMIPVNGTGLLPEISSSAASLEFDELTTGKTSGLEPLLITNLGEADLKIDLVGITGPNALSFDAQGDGCSFQVLEPGDSCLLEITFRPLAIGDLSASLIVPSSDPLTPVLSVALIGKGKGSGGCSLSPLGQVGRGFHLLLAAIFLSAIFLRRKESTDGSL